MTFDEWCDKHLIRTADEKEYEATKALYKNCWMESRVESANMMLNAYRHTLLSQLNLEN